MTRLLIIFLCATTQLWAEESIKLKTRSQVIEVSLVERKRVDELFDYLKKQQHIPCDYPDEGCYARAHEMVQLLFYHVAPVVAGKEGGKPQVYVLDPSIFKGPVTVRTWLKGMLLEPGTFVEEIYFATRFTYQGFDQDRPAYLESEQLENHYTLKRFLGLQQERQKRRR